MINTVPLYQSEDEAAELCPNRCHACANNFSTIGVEPSAHLPQATVFVTFRRHCTVEREAGVGIYLSLKAVVELYCRHEIACSRVLMYPTNPLMTHNTQ